MASSTTFYVLVFFGVVACAIVQAWPEQRPPASWPQQRQERPERPQKGLQVQQGRPTNSFGEDVVMPAASNQFVARRAPSSLLRGDEQDLEGAQSGIQNRRGGGPGGRPFGVIGEDIDNEPSATGHHGHHHGRVQIKVYRGQSKGHGWDSFAPYGYWVRQPPDNHGHHHGY